MRHIYLSRPFHNVPIQDCLIIRYMFKNFQCCFYHNPNFSQTLNEKVTWNTEVGRKIPAVLLTVQLLCWVVIGGLRVLAASPVSAVIAVWRRGKASLAGEPPSTYKQQTKSYSVYSHICSIFNSSTFEIHNLLRAVFWVSHAYQFHSIPFHSIPFTTLQLEKTETH